MSLLFHLVNDATETNTSVSVIRMGSPTPSLQAELDEQEELEREMAKTHVNDDNDDVDNVGNEKDDATDEEDEEDDEEEEDGDDEEDDEEDDYVDSEEGDESTDENIKKVEKVAVKTRTKTAVVVPTSTKKGGKVEVEKIPNVCLTVENFFNPAEAKKLAADILSKFYFLYKLIKLSHSYPRLFLGNKNVSEIENIASQKKFNFIIS